MRFYIGLHQLKDAQHFDQCFLSVNRLRRRQGAFKVKKWIMDSGAFTEVSKFGEYRHSVKNYADEAKRWEKKGGGFDVVNGRADFRLIAGSLKDGNLTLFYRRLELIGGLHYDLALIAAVEDAMGPLKTITIMAVKADAFTRKGGSNEKLYKQLTKRYNALTSD